MKNSTTTTTTKMKLHAIGIFGIMLQMGFGAPALAFPLPTSRETNRLELKIVEPKTTSAPLRRTPNGTLKCSMLPTGPKEWGQRIQISVYGYLAGKPVKGLYIQTWFSGDNGRQLFTGGYYTDATGRATFTANIPRWNGLSKKVDFNASANKIAAFGSWRVK